MNNIHLDRDHKLHNFKQMKLSRQEASNEILAVDSSVTHHYSYKSRKHLNSDWQALQKLKY